jgi:hypothetical protein
MVRNKWLGKVNNVPGTNMRLNSASTLVFVEGRISPNWARLARSPTILKCSLVETNFKQGSTIFKSKTFRHGLDTPSETGTNTQQVQILGDFLEAILSTNS